MSLRRPGTRHGVFPTARTGRRVPAHRRTPSQMPQAHDEAVEELDDVVRREGRVVDDLRGRGVVVDGERPGRLAQGLDGVRFEGRHRNDDARSSSPPAPGLPSRVVDAVGIELVPDAVGVPESSRGSSPPVLASTRSESEVSICSTWRRCPGWTTSSISAAARRRRQPTRSLLQCAPAPTNRGVPFRAGAGRRGSPGARCRPGRGRSAPGPRSRRR